MKVEAKIKTKTGREIEFTPPPAFTQRFERFMVFMRDMFPEIPIDEINVRIKETD